MILLLSEKCGKTLVNCCNLIWKNVSSVWCDDSVLEAEDLNLVVSSVSLVLVDVDEVHEVVSGHQDLVMCIELSWILDDLSDMLGLLHGALADIAVVTDMDYSLVYLVSVVLLSVL